MIFKILMIILQLILYNKKIILINMILKYKLVKIYYYIKI